MTDVQMIFIYLACNLLRIYTIARFFRLFLHDTYEKVWCIRVLYVLYFVCNSLAFVVWSTVIVNVLSNLIFLLCITFCYKAKSTVRFLLVALIFSTNLLIESIVVPFFQFQKDDVYMVLINVISNLIWFAFVCILERTVKSVTQEKLPLSAWASVCVFPIFSIYLCTILLVEPYRNSAFLLTTCIGLLLLLNIIMLFLYEKLKQSYKRAFEMQLVQRQNHALEKQYTLILHTDENMRMLRHDFKRHITILRQMLNGQATEQAEMYLRDLESTLQSADEHVKTGNIAIDSILNYMITQAEKRAIHVTHHIQVPQTLCITAFDLTALIGNLMENAIEATERLSSNADRTITLRLTFRQNVLSLYISNPIESEPLHDGKRFRTSKATSQEHGLGLSIVQETVEKYHGEFHVTCKDGFFVVQTLLFNPSNMQKVEVLTSKS